jgi:hypothetical protein
MLAGNRNLDPKSRRMLAIGCACLSIGLTLRILIHPSTPGTKIFVHVVVGLLIGLSIGLNLFALDLTRRRRANRT